MRGFLGLITRRKAERVAAAVADIAAHQQVALYQQRDLARDATLRLEQVIRDLRMSALLLDGMVRDERMSQARRLEVARDLSGLMVRVADRAVPRS